MTVLDCLVLEKSQEPVFLSLSDKLNYMWGHFDDKYSKQLRSIIGTLLNEDYKKRPNPHDLVQLAQVNQSKFTWFFCFSFNNESIKKLFRFLTVDDLYLAKDKNLK